MVPVVWFLGLQQDGRAGQVGEWVAGFDLAINECSSHHLYLLSPAKMTGGVRDSVGGKGNLRDISWHRDLDTWAVCMMPLPSMSGRRLVCRHCQPTQPADSGSRTLPKTKWLAPRWIQTTVGKVGAVA